MVADWPGLDERNLFEGRDLLPTTDLRSVLKGLLVAQLDLSEPRLSQVVFPGSEAVRPMQGLLRS